MTNAKREAVLEIWIKKKLISQGKFCYLAGKPHFVANMTEIKLWRNYNGYSIAKRILDSFSKLKIRATIIYKRPDLNQYYITKPSVFTKKGILVKYGEHSQWVLPLKNWEVKTGTLENEPRHLPVIELSSWEKEVPEDFTKFSLLKAYKMYKWARGADINRNLSHGATLEN